MYQATLSRCIPIYQDIWGRSFGQEKTKNLFMLQLCSSCVTGCDWAERRPAGHLLSFVRVAYSSSNAVSVPVRGGAVPTL